MNPAEGMLRRVDVLQQRYRPAAFLFGVVKKYGDDNGGTLVTNIAYSGFVAVFPLLLVLVSGLGLVLAGDPHLRDQLINSAYSRFPVVGNQLHSNIHSLRRSSTIGLIVGLVVLIWGSQGVAQSGLYAMAEVWNVPGAVRPGYLKRLGRSLGFLAVMAIGLVVTTFLTGFSTFGRHNVLLGYLAVALGALVNIGQFYLAFRVLTPKQVSHRRLVPGAVVGGIGWTILQALGGYLVGHQLKGASATYGTFAFVLALLAWIYLGAELAVYSAEVNVVVADRLWPRGLVHPPLTEADQRSLSRQATQQQQRPEQQVEVTFSQEPMSQEQYLQRQAAGDPAEPPQGREAAESRHN